MDIIDLVVKCSNALAIANICENYVSEMNMPTEEPARSDCENIISAIHVMRDMLQEINNIAESLDAEYWKARVKKAEEGANA